MTTPAVAACRVAIMRGPLIPHGRHYKFGRRLFSGATVAAARAAGDITLAEKRGQPMRLMFSDEETEIIKAMADQEDRSVQNMVLRLVRQAIKARQAKGEETQ